MWDSSDSDSDIEEDYNPYDNYANNRYRKCIYGAYILEDGYCCHACFLKQKEIRNNIKDNFINNMFGYTIIEDIFNNNVNEDWQIMKLIPPKTKKELRKQYRVLSLKYHPDKGGDPADFIKLKNSYDNLIICC